jgi:hypothetical protein
MSTLLNFLLGLLYFSLWVYLIDRSSDKNDKLASFLINLLLAFTLIMVLVSVIFDWDFQLF